MKGDRLYIKALLKAKLNENKEAFELLEKAIAYKNPKAYYALATWYLHGKYVKKDINKGNEYLKLSAERKNCHVLKYGYRLKIDLPSATARIFRVVVLNMALAVRSGKKR